VRKLIVLGSIAQSKDDEEAVVGMLQGTMKNDLQRIKLKVRK